jgi:preprotein translocase subunit Sec63
MAKIYHPDKQAEASPEEKEKAEREFLKIAQAYEVRFPDALPAYCEFPRCPIRIPLLIH